MRREASGWNISRAFVMGGGMPLSFSVHERGTRQVERKSTCNNSGSSSRAVWTKKAEVHSERSNHTPENRGTWLSSSTIKLDFGYFFFFLHDQSISRLNMSNDSLLYSSACMDLILLAECFFVLFLDRRIFCSNTEVHYNDDWNLKTFIFLLSSMDVAVGHSYDWWINSW